MSKRKIILIGGGTPYTPQVSQKAWDNLTPSQQIECLEQAQRGECSPPNGIPVGFWKAATHHMKYEGLAIVGHIEGGECETIRLTDLGEAYLMQANARTQEKKRDTAAAKKLESQELQEVKQELVKAGLIVEGRWAKEVSDFACLATELKETFGIVGERKQHGKTCYAWKDCALFAGFPTDKNSLESARGCSQYTQHGEIANTIRAICKKVHTKYVK